MKLKETGLTRQELIKKANDTMIEVYGRFDFVAERGEGAYVFDSDGNRYLDFIGGIAVNSAGHCNEKVVEAITGQARELIHASNYCHTVPQVVLAEKITKYTGMDKVFYQNSGTEANEAMIKLARKYGVEKYGPEKFEIVTASMSFHGRTMGALAATGQPDNACQQHFGRMLDGFVYADFNDLASFEAAVNDNTVAIMLEPIQAEGGVHPATDEFMKGIRQLCDEKGLLLLIDEVQTGWCRTGEIMAFMRYGIRPDAVTMAKALGGGMPIGCMAATNELAAFFTPGSHGSTFGGNPVCCAAACAQVDELIGGNLKENAERTGGYFMDELRKIPHVSEVRGAGLLVGIELEDGISAAVVKQRCRENGLLVTSIGDSVIRTVPPLIVTKEQCRTAAGIIGGAIRAEAGGRK